LMARSAVFVRPTFRDGDSISVREAVSLGVPVVASNVGSRPDGVALFEAGDISGLVEQIVKLHESCSSNPKSETSDWTPRQHESPPVQSAISDFGFEVSSNC